MVTVYSMPCGIAFRYAAIVAGNDGLDFPECGFNSSEAELDAVAGLTENGTGVCPDADGDTYVDCNCPGAPPVCDCNDADPNTHPNAPEACDAPTDYNCNGHHPEPCPPGLACNDSICISTCAGPESFCPVGSTCEFVDSGARLCVPTDCTVGGCPPGAVCDPATKKCVAACNGNVVCPPGEKCVGGECVDPCRDVRCSAGFTCIDGTCTPPCNCFAGDVGCTMGEKCDRPTDGGAGTNQCLPPDCIGVMCSAGNHCKPGVGCVSYCAGVMCPQNEVCVPPPLGDGITCMSGMKCDPLDGQCKSTASDGGLVVPDGGAGGDDGGLGDDGGGGGPNSDQGSGNDSGCGCTVLGGSNGSSYAFVIAGLIGLAGALARRRKR
jgi:MYXO-CTERM domain-containing protein